jgi:hypothetical protein
MRQKGREMPYYVLAVFISRCTILRKIRELQTCKRNAACCHPWYLDPPNPHTLEGRCYISWTLGVLPMNVPHDAIRMPMVSYVVIAVAGTVGLELRRYD